MTDILASLGLTADQVRKALGTEPPKRPSPPKLPPKPPPKYLNAHDQARAHRRLKLYEGFIHARFLEGYHPGTIARVLNVSEEAVRARLRKADYFKSG